MRRNDIRAAAAGHKKSGWLNYSFSIAWAYAAPCILLTLAKACEYVLDYLPVNGGSV
jgi:hypothetical protein